MGFGHLEKAVEKQKLTRHSGPLADRQRQCVCVTASRIDSDSEIEATRVQVQGTGGRTLRWSA